MPKTKGHVLLIDDDNAVRDLVAEVLRDAGFVVTEAGSGDQAAALLDKSKTFDLVFTDIRMPGSADGIQVAQMIRKLQPDIPILLSTGYAAHIDEQLGMLGPPTSYLNKPYSMAEMKEMVNRLLGNTV